MGTTQSKGPKITSHDRAVLDLKLQRDRIRQYQKKIQTTLEHETELARRALATSNKPLALSALRKKKYQQSLLAKTDEQLSTLQNLVSTIEFSQIQASVVEGLRQGNTVLRQINDSMKIQDVERILQDGEEARAYQQEIDEMLQSRMTNDEEEEVQREMEALEREANGLPPLPEQEQRQQQPPVELPSAPQTEPVAQPQPEEAALQPQAAGKPAASQRQQAEPMLA
ncbi:uncharacterized protein PFL1_04383 [Pseudozyma flocculosa PF-1]|uniref:Related to VPS20 - myristoylated subunit of the endosomal sorting complex n=2 Tax=Pseudozyma flocculosa TaxID=84751 RepID=A0A5C3FFS8_9BASI|nr:uncharacterized protein PFL1_04383 [Pseudozyma flocculosa PF-1]EPQ28056.1 hypothetical protein PFL1_04383 [Pseudozyma flocculosa PF-1]SPO42209.1 related to VPS20 - myristoylated subunit of the endosomal sorting complex [Pseudozyma flocculosa]